MYQRNACVIVHVTDRLEAQQASRLEYLVKAQLGVGQAQMSANARHLMRVDYDPRSTTAARILQSVVGQGYAARLIGM
jgi:hypothetical protein